MRRTLPFAALGLVVSTAAFLAPAGAAQEPVPQAAAPGTPQAAPPAAVAQASAPPEQPSGSKIWLGHNAEFEEYLKTAAIDNIGDIPIGVTKPKRAFFAKGGLAGSAALKYLPSGIKSGYWEAYKSEIAAYKLDRILGLDMVPPTIERRVGSNLASLQLWVEGCKHLKDTDQSKISGSLRWAKQVCRQRTFDNLIANVDRNAGNLLVDDEWNLVLIDHSRAFASSTMPFMKQMTRIDREFYEKLKALDEETLMRELKPWVLGGGTLRDILKRRDKIVAQFDRFVSEKGEAAVFPF
ncbi:MAG TPA: hypothetical protein VJ648_08740 [Vicinamibacteria bacterium]|nr:hypothetical protein [Vicinamibacteria bacterium]